MDERSVWYRIQNDDSKAFEKFFNLYYKTLCIYIMQFTNDRTDAEDIAQKTFINLWIKRTNIQIESSLKSYLFRSAYNAYVDEYRKTKQNDALLKKLKYNIISSLIDENDSLHDQRIDKVKVIIEKLPKRCKEILMLSKQKGLKNKDIAKNLNISIKTVEAQLRIAFSKIRNGFK